MNQDDQTTNQILEKFIDSLGITETEVGWEGVWEKEQETIESVEVHYAKKIKQAELHARIDELSDLDAYMGANPKRLQERVNHLQQQLEGGA